VGVVDGGRWGGWGGQGSEKGRAAPRARPPLYLSLSKTQPRPGWENKRTLLDSCSRTVSLPAYNLVSFLAAEAEPAMARAATAMICGE